MHKLYRLVYFLRRSCQELIAWLMNIVNYAWSYENNSYVQFHTQIFLFNSDSALTT